jgi:hypothetical protein
MRSQEGGEGARWRGNMRWGRLVAAAVLGCMLVLLLPLAIFGLILNRHPKSLAEVSRLSRIEFPAGTRLIRAHLYSGVGSEMKVRVELPREELGSLLKQTRLSSGRISNEDKFGMDNPSRGRPSWWRVAESREFVAVESPAVRPRWASQTRVLADLSGSTTVTVYIQIVGGG